MKIGLVTGAFDLMHAGHVHLFKQAKRNCDVLMVGLHVDPSIERPDKHRPIETLIERQIKIGGCDYVDGIFVYEKESDIPVMINFLHIDIRFLGSDYLANKKPITAEKLVPIEYIKSLDIHTSDIRRKL